MRKHLDPSPKTKSRYYTHNVVTGPIVSQITSLTIVFSTVYLATDQRKHQSAASLVFLWGIHRRPVTSPHKWSVRRKMFPFDDVIMTTADVASDDKVASLTHVRVFYEETLRLISIHTGFPFNCSFREQVIDRECITVFRESKCGARK